MVTFTVRRGKAEVVAPARPTPHETKALSDVDSSPRLRFYGAAVEFFRRCSTDGYNPEDPAKAIKVALAEALVFYYPMAGRLRELPDGRLVVDCTEEGVIFVEADADVILEDLGRPLSPPYPCVEQFFCEALDIMNVIGRPLLFMQVTRLRCGGFVIGALVCHSITDGVGNAQFIKAIADLAGGETHPVVLPVWKREILTARVPPRITQQEIYPAYELSDDCKSKNEMLSTPTESMVGRYFHFGPRDIAALRNHAAPEYFKQRTTTFELLTAVMWRCRTAALGYQSSERVRIVFISDARGRWNKNLPIPKGYYGNAIIFPTVEATVSDLCDRPLGHALELVRKAKFSLTEEHVKSMVDAMALLRGKPLSRPDRVYDVSDIRARGDIKVDLGWAQSVGGGVPVPKLTSYFMMHKNSDGEDVIVVSLLLPGPVMNRFSEQMAFLLNKKVGMFTRSYL